jgi:polyisoprenoid-binding protein YceI
MDEPMNPLGIAPEERTMRTTFATLLLAAALTLPLSASAASYKIDDSHTRVGFKVRHMMSSWVNGDFTEFGGEIVFDPDNLEESTVDITIAVDSVDTGNDKRDTHLRTGDFFAAKRFPEMTFVSTEIRNVGETSFEIVGDLTLRGVTQQVVLDVSWPGQAFRSPMGVLVYGFHAEAVIDRTEFGVDWNMPVSGGGLLVGEEIIITLDLELMKRG